MSKTYKTKTGKTQHMPSLEEVKAMDNNSEGFCLACGYVQDGVEPDARGYECDECGEAKVFGAQELAIMGLVY